MRPVYRTGSKVLLATVLGLLLAPGGAASASSKEEELRQSEAEAREWADRLQRQLDATGKSTPSRELLPSDSNLTEPPIVEEPPPAVSASTFKRKTVLSRDIRKDVYLIRVRDELEISVTGPAEVSRKVQVGENGSVFFPLIGNIPVTGRPLQQVEKDLEARLNRIYLPTKDPRRTTAPPIPRKIYSTAEIREEGYRLQLGDELAVSVWGHPDLERKVQLREDGTFSFPLVGDVAAQGRTLKEVEEEVQARLNRDFIVNPQVTARLSGEKYTVLGEVQRPGSYSMEGPLDLLTVISQAGGTNKSGLNRVEIIRERNHEELTIQANLDMILQGKELNVNILPRDTIYVMGLPSEGLQVRIKLSGAKFSVLGDVERPGSFAIDGSTDLLTALSESGGITKFGSSRIEIVREKGDTKYTIRANMDRILRGKEPNVEVLPRDTIFVRRRLF